MPPIARKPESSTNPVAATTPPTYLILHQAAPLAQPPALDGRLDDACWQALPEATEFFDADSAVPRRAASRTSLRVGYDQSGLYFAARCEDENAAAIRATLTRHGEPGLYLDDCLEFYVGDARLACGYRQLVVNALGTQNQSYADANGCHGHNTPPTTWRVATARDNRGWSAEVFFPYDALTGVGLTGAAGELCRFAVRRYVRSAAGRNAVTAPRAGWGHPERLGCLLLAPDVGPAESAWVQTALGKRLAGDWVVPQGESCLWKQGRTVRSARLADAARQATANLQEAMADPRAAEPRYAGALTRAAARLAALPDPDSPLAAAQVLLELGEINLSLRWKYLVAEHGVVCRLPGERFGYFGWPTVERLADGTLIVASSGLRADHICPWGKTVLHTSTDNGRTWSAPRVINDSPMDDRDAGLISLGGQRLLVSWFTLDVRKHVGDALFNGLSPEEVNLWKSALARMTPDALEQWEGSWIMLSETAGATWGAPIRVPVSTPHGPVRLRNGDLLYLGKRYGTNDDLHLACITAVHSVDGGRSWAILGSVPVCPGTDNANYHEPHVVELPSDRLLGMIRIENHAGRDLAGAGLLSFSMMQTESDDGGRTWTPARPLGFHGSPPHLLRHSSGVLLLTYGYRQAPYGQRVAFSRDDGATWDHDWIIRDDGPDGDLGYPSTVELPDGSLFTACYQKAAAGEKCSLLWSKWQLPEKDAIR